MNRLPRAEPCNLCGTRGCVEHCQWCGMAGEHTLDCPVALNVYPVAPEDVGLECAECNAPFELGGVYSYVNVAHPAVPIPVWAGVCLGCAAMSALLP